MRAKEFITEVKLHGTFGTMDPQVSSSLPAVIVQRELRNTDPYMQYRYGLALAGARAAQEHDTQFDQESAWAENLAIITYTPEDEETIRLADKMMGVTGTKIGKTGSRETSDVNAQSPVAKPKKNKYGV
jgi:hypothetical protein|tara:strand:- start:12 stop:398 length:387 start_codon:yes stop_codon:yes gene_type:complete